LNDAVPWPLSNRIIPALDLMLLL